VIARAPTYGPVARGVEEMKVAVMGCIVNGPRRVDTLRGDRTYPAIGEPVLTN
jgi:hypothetical protein